MAGHYISYIYLALLSIQLLCGASARNSDTVSVLCRERLWVVEDLKGRYRNGRNERNEYFIYLFSTVI